LISDQSPRGAYGDETMTTTAEEAAALAANVALPERIIDGGQGRAAFGPCQAEGGPKSFGHWNKTHFGILLGVVKTLLSPIVFLAAAATLLADPDMKSTKSADSTAQGAACAVGAKSACGLPSRASMILSGKASFAALAAVSSAVVAIVSSHAPRGL
jgi:hypothetical protein